MQKRQNRLKAAVAITAVSLALLFCSCVKELPSDVAINVEGRETLFAPAETTSPYETVETMDTRETTATPPSKETTASPDETTTPETETTAPETTENAETENPVFNGGFSGLY